MAVTPAVDPEQRARLNQAKLRAVVRAHTGSDRLEDRSMGALAAVVTSDGGGGDGSGGGDGYALITEATGVGAALAWARRQQLGGAPQLIVDSGAEATAAAGTVARRAALFADAPQVWELHGTQLRPVVAAPHPPVMAAAADALAAIEPLRSAGADIVVEHGVVMAELAGLEVGRVVPDQDGLGVHLEIGVGHHDRDAGQIMEAVLSTQRMTRNVVDVVRGHRRPGEPPHLLTRIARQRWLRAMVINRPELVDASTLEPLEPPLPRRNLIEPVPALAAGVGRDGSPVVVACAVGVDLEAIPTAADGRARFDPEAELVYAAPARDLYPVIRDLAAALARPARLVALDGEWAD